MNVDWGGKARKSSETIAPWEEPVLTSEGDHFSPYNQFTGYFYAYVFKVFLPP